MTIFEVLLSETARKQLRELSPDLQDDIKDKMRELRMGPFVSGPRTDIKKLKGDKRDYYRLRVGRYRVLYVIEGDRVLVAKVLPRSKAYEWIE